VTRGVPIVLSCSVGDIEGVDWTVLFRPVLEWNASYADTDVHEQHELEYENISTGLCSPTKEDTPGS
jgi:hypothetical protein